MKNQTVEVKKWDDEKKSATFTLNTPETVEELLELTGVADPFKYVVEKWQDKVTNKMSRALFARTIMAFGKKKKLKALETEEDIQAAIKKCKLVKVKKSNGELTPAEFRARLVKQLEDAGRTPEQIEAFMEQYDENIAEAEAASE